MATLLSGNQIASLITAGTFLWGVGVVKIRYAASLCYSNKQKRLATFLVTLPLSYGMVHAVEAIFVRTPIQRFPVITILAGTTLILDGIGFNFFPWLYENEQVKKINPQVAAEYSRAGAAWLLYGTGMCIFIAAIIS